MVKFSSEEFSKVVILWLVEVFDDLLCVVELPFKEDHFAEEVDKINFSEDVCGCVGHGLELTKK